YRRRRIRRPCLRRERQGHRHQPGHPDEPAVNGQFWRSDSTRTCAPEKTRAVTGRAGIEERLRRRLVARRPAPADLAVLARAWRLLSPERQLGRLRIDRLSDRESR